MISNNCEVILLTKIVKTPHMCKSPDKFSVDKWKRDKYYTGPVNMSVSPPERIRSTTCLCVAPSTFTPFL